MRGILSLVIVLLLTGIVAATTINVPGQYTTIQAGINAASEGDTVLIADGVYIGASNKNLDFGGRNIVLKSSGGPENCIIDCQASGRGFYFHRNETSSAVVEGISVRNGSSTYGGGINVTNSSPTFKHCIITGCLSASSYGGGVYVNNGDPTFTNCTIYFNSSLNGGAMYVTNTNMVVTTCILASNVASG